jgi:hypothetical protein
VEVADLPPELRADAEEGGGTVAGDWVTALENMFLRMQNMLTDNYSQLIMVIVCMRCGTARTSCS